MADLFNCGSYNNNKVDFEDEQILKIWTGLTWLGIILSGRFF
jgi:hypothetical protein